MQVSLKVQEICIPPQHGTELKLLLKIMGKMRSPINVQNMFTLPVKKNADENDTFSLLLSY